MWMNSKAVEYPPGKNGGVNQSVEAGVGGRQCSVDGIGALPLSSFIRTPLPVDSMFFGGVGISLPDTDAFFTTKLLERKAQIGLVVESKAVHPHHDLKTSDGIADKLCLVDEISTVACLRRFPCTPADGMFTGRENQAVVFGRGLDCRVRNGGARAQDQHRHAATTGTDVVPSARCTAMALSS